MENATKALLIAGGVLISIMVILAGIYLHSVLSEQSAQYKDIISATELEKFNSKFNVYIGRKNITAQEIISAVNLAKEYDNQVEIFLGSRKLEFTDTTQEDFLKLNLNENFSCEGSDTNPQYNNYGKIIKLTFKKL